MPQHQNPATSQPRGSHLLIDLYTESASLADPVLMESAIRAAVDASGAQLIQYRSHTFEGGGLTAFAMLAESHLSVHTWPEIGFAAFDIFTCGPNTDPHRARQVIEAFYPPQRITLRDITRGD